jgi:phosphoribosylformimino-5-aminoimidazole carboxamide ribotide isomerase
VKIIPAIDIKDGNVVRLTRGDYEKVTCYSDNPADIAKKWCSQGASILHVVDLDGALKGSPQNMDSIASIVKSVEIPIELGGGIRNLESIEWAFNVGVSKVILGTKVAENMSFITSAIRKYGKRIAASIDSKDGLVVIRGWTKLSSVNAIDVARKMKNIGASSIIYTDVIVDGTLHGPNFIRLDNFLNNVDMPVTVAGGVASMDDIRKLYALNKKNLAGVIVGKALYEGKINLREAIKYAYEKNNPLP